MIRPHPNICRLLGVCLTDPVCIVLELLDGNILQLALDGQIDLHVNRVIKIAMDVSSAMSHLHVFTFPFDLLIIKSERIIHCDLAARNLLALLKGRKCLVKITDFGLSEILLSGEDSVHTGTFSFSFNKPTLQNEKNFQLDGVHQKFSLNTLYPKHLMSGLLVFLSFGTH